MGHTCSECHWEIQLRGKDPQTNQEIDKKGCAMAFLPILLIENSQQQHQTAAAVESTRNVMAKGMDSIARQVLIAGQANDLRLVGDGK